MADKNKKVGELYELMLDDLLDLLRNGELTPGDRKLIVQIAQDHKMQIDTAVPGNFIEGLGDMLDLPFQNGSEEV